MANTTIATLIDDNITATNFRYGPASTELQAVLDAINSYISDTIAYTTAIPFTRMVTGIGAHTLTGDIVLTKVTANAVVGAGAILRITSDGSSTVDVSAFKTTSTSSDFVTTDDTVNVFLFFYDGVDYWVTIFQEAGTVELTQLATPTLTMTVDSDDQITFSWTNVANESSYSVQIAEDSGFTTGVQTATPAADDTSHPFTGLTADTLYYGRVKAVGDGITYSDSAYGTDSDTTDAGGGSHEAEFTTYYGTVTTAGGSLTTGQQDAYNDFYATLKTNNLDDKFVDFGFCAGGIAASNALSFKGLHNLVFNGGWTHSALGSKPNGTTGYASITTLGANHADLSQNNAALWFGTDENTQNGSENFQTDIGCGFGDSANNFYLTAGFTLPTLRYVTGVINEWPTANNPIINGSATTKGLTMATRSGSGFSTVYQNNETPDAGTETSSGQPALLIYLGARNNNGTADRFSNRRCVFWGVSTSFDATEWGIVETAFDTLQTALGL